MNSEDQLQPLRLPGLWIDHQDRDWAFQMRILLNEVLDQINEAALVLDLYQASIDSMRAQPVTAPSNLSHLYARCFVYALDTVRQLLKVIRDDPQLPSSAHNHCDTFLAEYENIRNLRNSLHHIEDRLRCLGPGGSRISAPLLLLGCFRNDHFGCTAADGTYAEIELSQATLRRAGTIIEDLIGSFTWLGPGNARIHQAEPGA